jgi:response regulator RpfG family c-di-GMP phosphodiesterase
MEPTPFAKLSREGKYEVNVKLTVLYLDDEPICLDVFSETFRREYDVRVAASADQAWRLLAERPADIVISDQKMPGVKGTDFLGQVAARYPTSYRVLLTGSIPLVSVLPEVGAGLIHLFVPKPWTEADMRRMLERAGAHFEAGAHGR